MLQNAYLLAKIGADTAENERNLRVPTAQAKGDELASAGASSTAAGDADAEPVRRA